MTKTKKNPTNQALPEAFLESLYLSNPSEQEAMIRAIIAMTPDVDDKRVQAVRSQIESSQYLIDSGKIAEKIMETMDTSLLEAPELA